MEREQERRQRLYRVSAIVLKRRDMGEADRLLTVLARERGKLTLLAKGVRKPASRKAGHIEPFTHVDLLVAKGKSIDLVTQAETIAAHRRLREDLWHSSLAYYVVELVDVFTQEADPNALVFDLLLETLGRLDEDANPALAVRYAEMHLLGLVGYQPQLFHCLHCNRLLKPETNYFSLELGGALCPEHRAVGPTIEELPLPVLKVLRFMQTRDWEQVAQLRLRPELGREVEALLARYIVYHLERNLRSTAFLERLREARAVTGQRHGAHAAGQPPGPGPASSANESNSDPTVTTDNSPAANGPDSPQDRAPLAGN